MKSFFHKFIDFRGRMGRRDYVEHFLFLFIIGLINVGANLVLHRIPLGTEKSGKFFSPYQADLPLFSVPSGKSNFRFVRL